MNRSKTVAGGILFAVLALLPLAAEAQTHYSYTVSVLGGVGGSIDEEDTTGLGNGSFEVGFSVVSADQLLVGGRVGTIEFDDNDSLGRVIRPALDYIHIGGEYRFTEPVYESGVYFGLGYFQLDGLEVLPGDLDQPSQIIDASDDSLGLVLALSGEFRATSKIGFLVQINAYVTDFASSSLFTTAHAGFAFHF